MSSWCSFIRAPPHGDRGLVDNNDDDRMGCVGDDDDNVLSVEKNKKTNLESMFRKEKEG